MKNCENGKHEGHFGDGVEFVSTEPTICQCQRERMEALSDEIEKMSSRKWEKSRDSIRRMPQAERARFTEKQNAILNAHALGLPVSQESVAEAFGVPPTGTPLVRSCVTCEKEFKPINPDAIYCSSPCFDAQRDYGIKKMVEAMGREMAEILDTKTDEKGNLWARCYSCKEYGCDLRAPDCTNEAHVISNERLAVAVAMEPDSNEHPLLKRSRERREAEDRKK